MAEIARNIARVQERIAQAAARSGRTAEAVTLLVVSKTVAPARIAEAYATGQREFGESYVQEALAKIEQTRQTLPDIRWHLIGHLQSNKVRSVIAPFALLESVDSLALAREIGKRARQMERIADILLEVKLDTASARKVGIAPEATLETARQVEALDGLRLCGLMGIAPYAEDPELTRPYFRALRALFEQLSPAAQQTLSMGMSGDFEVAVEEGSTLVRIGSAIFGMRGT